VLWGVVGGGAFLVVVAELARGRSPAGVLGAYSVVGHQHFAVGDVLRWLLYHVAELDLYLGVVPFAALLVLAVRARELPRPAQAFVAAAVAVSAWLVVEVAAFASIPTVERVEERNLFYVAPLFFVALLVWIDRGLPRPRRVAVPIAVAAAGLLAVLPYTTLIGVQVQSDTLELLPWWWLQDHWITLGQVWIAALALGIALAALFLFVPRRFALVLPAAVLAYYVVTLAPIENGRHGVRWPRSARCSRASRRATAIGWTTASGRTVASRSCGRAGRRPSRSGRTSSSTAAWAGVRPRQPARRWTARDGGTRRPA